jgi:nucleotide-binding universal stress UspA family protein
MYEHVLIPTDGSALSEMAGRQGVALAKAIDAKVTGITVSPPFHTVTLDPMMVTATAGEHEKDCAARAEQYLAVIRDAAQAARVPYEGVHAIDDYPYQAIIRTAQGKGCDLIFMASHGRKGMSALVLGSETTKVLTHTKIPVLVCR